jgi:hypothetical protein
MDVPAAAPFVFLGCIELQELLGLRARDERELMEQLERAPLGSVYYHTHSVFLRHARVPGTFPNDFANWAASQVGDQALGERLAVVDPFAVETLEELRDELVSVIDLHIAALHPVPRVVFGDPFFFVQSHVVEVPTGLAAQTLGEFRRCVAEVDASSIYYHALESRVRRGRRRGDFAEWIEGALGLAALAGKIARIDPYVGGLEEMRTRMLGLLDGALAEEGPPRDR